MPDPVIKTIDVPCPPNVAFRIFTQDVGHWWPRDTHSVSAQKGGTARSIAIEPHEGGAITEVGHDGTQYVWGSVVTFDPGARLSMRWHIEAPEREATRVDVAFTAIGTGTQVILTHHGWEALGDGAQKQRDSYDSGWVGVFETAYAQACHAAAT